MEAVAVGVIVACAVLLIGGTRIYLKHARRQAAADRRRGIIARFDDIAISRSELYEGYGAVHGAPLAGVRASIDSVGQLTSRVTLTRVAAVGILALALRKRQDDRSVFLTIVGPGVPIVRELPVHGDPRVQRTAREFAALVNATAQAFEARPQNAAPQAS